MMIYRKVALTIWMSTCFASLSFSQVFFTEVHSRWNDRFDEWEVFGSTVDDEEFVVQFDLVWPLQRNWEEWRIGGDLFEGSIRAKWPGDPGQWEMRINGDIIMINQLNRNDGNRWEIRNGTSRELLQTQWFNNPTQWFFPRHREQWVQYMEREGDPRDWIIEDYLEEITDPGTRLAAIFIIIWQTIPK